MPSSYGHRGAAHSSEGGTGRGRVEVRSSILRPLRRPTFLSRAKTMTRGAISERSTCQKLDRQDSLRAKQNTLKPLSENRGLLPSMMSPLVVLFSDRTSLAPILRASMHTKSLIYLVHPRNVLSKCRMRLIVSCITLCNAGYRYASSQ